MIDLFGIGCFPALFAALVVVFALREAFTYRDNIKIKYLLTPLITLIVIGFAVLSISNRGFSFYRGMVLLSLVFALVADTMLMIVETNLLKYGIIYFLLGHVLYIGAFSEGYSYNPWNILVLALMLAYVGIFYYFVRGKTGGMDVPVLAYMLVITAMMFFAFSGFNRFWGAREVMIAVGAVLFMLSDSILAVNAFVFKIPHSTVYTWALYAPAQFLFAVSCFY